MNRHFKSLLPFLLSLISSMTAFCHGLDDYHVKYIEVEDGLCDQYVQSTYKDSRGYLWICTANGLDRFDGQTFVHYNSHSTDETTRIDNNCIFAAVEDDSGNIWFTSSSGLSVIGNDGKARKMIDGSFSPLGKDRSGNLWTCSQNRLMCIKPDSSGEFTLRDTLELIDFTKIQYMFIANETVWIGSDIGILSFCLTSKGEIQRIPCDPALTQIRDITTITSSRNLLWIGSLNGLYEYNLRDQSLRLFSTDDGDSISDNHITSLVEDTNGNLFVGSTKGIDLFRTDGTVSHMRSMAGVRSLNNDYVTHLMADSNGQIWVSTLVGGINLLTKSFISISSNLSVPNRKNQIISCVFQDKAGNLLAGVLGKGLAIKEAGSGEFKIISLKETAGLTQEDIFSICQDSSGNYWIASRSDGLVRMSGSSLASPVFSVFNSTDCGLTSNYIVSILPSQSGQALWINTDKSLQYLDISKMSFQNVDTGDMMKDQHIFSHIFMDSSGRLWIGGKGIMVMDTNTFDSNTGKCTLQYYEKGPNNSEDSIPQAITSITETTDGNIYAGTQNNGVYLLRQKEGMLDFSFESLTTEGIHIRDRVSKLLGDNFGGLWIGTANGLYFYESYHRRITRFSIDDGLPANQCYKNSGFKSGDNHIYFGSVNGIYDITTPVIVAGHTDNSAKITAIYNGGLILDKEISHIDIYPSDPSFDIFYSTMDGPYSSNVVFSYRIVGLDHDWTYTKTGHCHYSNLKPGHFTFQIRCTNTDGSWSESATNLQLFIHPRFYQTTWFHMLAILFLASLVLLYILQYTETQKKAKDNLSKEVKERTRELEETLDHLKVSRESINIQKTKVEEYAMKLESMSEEKQRLYTSLTHELKTPLTLILGPARTLSKLTWDNSEVTESVKIIERNARKMFTLVNRIMELRTSNPYYLNLNPEEIDIRAMLERYKIDFSSVIKSRALHYTTIARISHTLSMDKEALDKIFVNLISNATKYTPDGGSISVYVSELRTKESGESRLYISVNNTGSFIPETEQDKIFDCFYRVEDQERFLLSRQTSTGIGLHLVKSIVSTMGGSITVKSSLNTGTSFRVLLPVTYLVKLPQQDIYMDSGTTDGDIPFEDSGDKSRPLLLLVEDNDEVRTYIKGLLIKDYRVAEAANGRTGYEMALKLIPDFIISDLMMPFCDGIEFCNRIRHNNSLSHIPFLMLTALSDDDVRLKSYIGGADDYLTKPFDPEMLQIRVKNILEKRVRSQEKLSFDLTKSYAEIHMDNPDEIFMDKLNTILNQRFSDPDFGVPELQQALYMSSTPFYKKIMALTGLTPSHLIRLFRLQTAKKILMEHKGKSGITISEVAYLVGFNDPKYFTRCFSTQFGELPSAILQSPEEG